MTEQSNPLQRYTAIADTLDTFTAQYATVISRYATLQQAKDEAEIALKRWARDHGTIENDSFKVNVQYKIRSWYDADEILRLAPYVREIPGVVEQTINKAKIEALAKAKAIDESVCQQALREEPMVPAVSIKVKERISF